MQCSRHWLSSAAAVKRKFKVKTIAQLTGRRHALLKCCQVSGMHNCIQAVQQAQVQLKEMNRESKWLDILLLNGSSPAERLAL